VARIAPKTIETIEIDVCPECGGAVAVWQAKAFGGEDAVMRQCQQCGWRTAERTAEVRTHG
jgi:rRNA maturation protein Nop10